MSTSRIYWLGGVVITIGLIIAAFFPVSGARLVSAGVDTYSAHRPLFNNRTISQTVSSPYPITGIGLILVDMRRANDPADTIVKITSSPDNKVLAEQTIPFSSLQDDSFTRIEFNPPITNGEELNIAVNAPTASSQNPIGVRIDPNAPQEFNEAGNIRKGSMALEVIEKVPGWKAAVTAISRHQDSWKKILEAVLGVTLISFLAFYLPRPTWSQKAVKVFEISVLTILALTVIATRLPFLSSFSGVSGGDPYNYLLIAQSLTRLESPFNEGEKRLPGYPLVLIPTVLSHTADDQLYMRMVSVISAAGCMILLALLARALQLPWSVQLISPLIIAWQKDFFTTSMRPEPYTFYACLLLGTLVLFFSKRKPWQEILFGILLGWSAMTRQEGFVLAVLLGIAWFLPIHSSSSTNIRAKAFSFMRMFVPALILVLPFFAHNTIQYGNPLATPYFESDRLQIVNSWEAFKDNSAGTWGVLGSMWRVSWDELERYNVLDIPVLLGVAITLGWWLKNAYAPENRKKMIAIASIAAASIVGIVIIAWALVAKSSVTSSLPPIIAGSVLICWLPFLSISGRKGALVMIIALSQILIATWFHPFAKHYQQAFPLLALLLCTTWLIPRKDSPLQSFSKAWVTSIVLLLPIAYLTIIPYSSIHIMIDKQNENAAIDSVAYRAVKFALTQPGPYGSDQAYLSARFYFGNEGKYFYDETSTFEQEAQWLKENGVKTFIVTNEDKTFKTPHPTWHELKRFKAAGKDERIFESVVYHIDTP